MCHGSHIYIPILYLVKTLYAKKIEFIYNTQLSFDFHKSRNCTVYVYQKQNAEKKDFIEEACNYKFSVIIYILFEDDIFNLRTSKRSSYMEIPIQFPILSLP